MTAGIYVAPIAILSGLLPARNLAALEIAVAGEHAARRRRKRPGRGRAVVITSLSNG